MPRPLINSSTVPAPDIAACARSRSCSVTTPSVCPPGGYVMLFLVPKIVETIITWAAK